MPVSIYSIGRVFWGTLSDTQNSAKISPWVQTHYRSSVNDSEKQNYIKSSSSLHFLAI